MDSIPDYVRYLLQPAAYRPPVPDVRLVQTHISFVLLAGDFVYKFKKPMDFGFLNFTTLERRKHFCGQELVLNRRLCPTIYLDLVCVSRTPAGGLELNGSGTPVEYGIKMVRMPEERMMGTIIRSGGLNREMIDEIVAVLGPFYAKADAGAEIERYATAEAVGANVLENLEQCEHFIGCPSLNREEYDQIGDYVRGFLGNKGILNGRLAAGRIKDCHGDLHSANICLADRVYIYDCIEFNHRFRYSDVASDVAFLAMDLDYHGHGELADYFIDRFIAMTDDQGLSAVLNFYKCYRATVRGKIGLLTAHEQEVDDTTRAQALEQAKRYFVLAQRYAARCRGGVC